jgi:hypothetical protein
VVERAVAQARRWAEETGSSTIKESVDGIMSLSTGIHKTRAVQGSSFPDKRAVSAWVVCSYMFFLCLYLGCEGLRCGGFELPQDISNFLEILEAAECWPATDTKHVQLIHSR